MGRRRLLGLLGALAACGSGGSTSAPTSTGVLSTNATVIYVTDGDTIGVKIDGVEERVRLIGIDTPETKKPNTPVQCFGPEATAFTKSLLPKGTALHVERDVEARDVYGRLLAYVYRSADGLFVNMDIIGHGYARPLAIAPDVAHADEFTVAARTAETANLGLWAACIG